MAARTCFSGYHLIIEQLTLKTMFRINQETDDSVSVAHESWDQDQKAFEFTTAMHCNKSNDPIGQVTGS